MSKKKILIIRFHAIGDIVLSSVIPYAIKKKHPDCEIHYLTSPDHAPIIENFPYVDKILTFANDVKGTSKILRAEKYDVIISLVYTLKSYALSFLALPKKVVFRSGKGTSWVENYFYTAKKVFKDVELPERLFMENTDKEIEKSVSEKLSAYPKPHIFINPGRHVNNARQGRIWNIEKWKVLSQKLLKKYGGTIFVNGSVGERDYHMSLEDKNVVILSGEFDLKESFAALSMADLLVSGDSGPLHVASAYNVKCIAILGSTSPDKIKPYGENGYILEPKTECKYCWKKKCTQIQNDLEYTPCIESISPDDVMQKIAENNLLQGCVIA